VRILVPAVDASWRVAQQMGASLLWPVADRAYGLRDFTFVGPDGVGLGFATRLRNQQDSSRP
jgi:hypothetical protein